MAHRDSQPASTHTHIIQYRFSGVDPLHWKKNYPCFGTTAVATAAVVVVATAAVLHHIMIFLYSGARDDRPMAMFYLQPESHTYTFTFIFILALLLKDEVLQLCICALCGRSLHLGNRFCVIQSMEWGHQWALLSVSTHRKFKWPEGIHTYPSFFAHFLPSTILL